MATRRTSFDKLQRERAKRAKAADKRERRQERSGGSDATAIDTVDVDEELTAGEIMARLEALHARFEAKTVDFDTFEEQKRELLERLAALPMD